MIGKLSKPTAAIALDILILITAFILARLLWIYADESRRPFALWMLGIVMLGWLVYEARMMIRVFNTPRDTDTPRDTQVSGLVLLNEDGTGIKSWDLRDKTGLVIGRSQDAADVDVDLSGTEYFSLISDLHAVLNITEKGWLLADAGSQNGTALIHEGSNQRLQLAPGEPVPIRQGDTICIAGETKIKVS